MEEPHIAGKKPAVIELEPGTYYWCRCGRSQTQPFCDESHKVTSFTPVEFEIKEKQRIILCVCKHTHTPPFCDNTHKSPRFRGGD